MSVCLVAALVLALTSQSPQNDRMAAEKLARSGQTVEALALFERILAQNPTDVEARMWTARLYLRLGRNTEAEAGFRAILLQKPSDIDARIGLAVSLNRRDRWREARAILLDVEKEAGDNAELFAALARNHRRSGDDRSALEYYRRALLVAPDDPEIIEAYEATVRAYGHSIEVEGFAEAGASDSQDISVVATVRVVPRLSLDGIARVQNRSGVSDSQFGVGGIFKVNRSTILQFRAGGGANNVALANGDVTAEVRHYRGPFELGFNFRYLSYTDVDVGSFSPILAWDTGTRWRLGARYSYSRSAFATTGQSSGDHSALVRETFRVSRRVDTTLTYAYGIESFEDLTADRIGNLGGNTVAVSARIRMPSLTTLAATWEHQWRSNDTQIDRVTLLFVQRFQ